MIAERKKRAKHIIGFRKMDSLFLSESDGRTKRWYRLFAIRNCSNPLVFLKERSNSEQRVVAISTIGNIVRRRFLIKNIIFKCCCSPEKWTVSFGGFVQIARKMENLRERVISITLINAATAVRSLTKKQRVYAG